ncbi:MAG TPA: hypothetical protein VJ867_09825 [Gemmatimonadaceae bacterium]|nr:hypothetical protein [Gemmatimonadaceae bacterium]
MLNRTLALALVVVSVNGCTADRAHGHDTLTIAPAAAAATTSVENPLLAAIRDTLRARNPAIGAVGIVEQRSLDYLSGPTVVIGYGVREDREFKGDFHDELFGIFVVNDSLTRIVRTLDVLPSARWRDYSVRIVTLTADSVVIESKNATYGNIGWDRAYALER